MAINDYEALEQQRLRRKRINRIKTGIIMTIAIWMIGSLLAIIILSVQVSQAPGLPAASWGNQRQWPGNSDKPGYQKQGS